MEKPLLSIILPVYNEANTFEELVQKVITKAVPDCNKEIIIVESNSTDGTKELVKKYENLSEVTVIYQNKPQGKGFAVREGLKASTGDIILIQDADLEYDVEDYDSLIKPILKNEADFVLGSRHLGNKSWKIRKFENYWTTSIFMNLGDRIFRTLFNLLYKVSLTDPTTMYKVFRKECIKGICFKCKRFDFDFELLARLIRRGYKPIEVPVSYRSRHFNEGKKINVLRDPWTWLYTILKYRFIR